MPAISGIELSRRFYQELVRPWLERTSPGLRHAAALIGYGSELLGFDDAMSQDHDWGPRILLFVDEADFGRCAQQLPAAFADAAPPTFLGAPLAGAKPLEVCTVPQALGRWLGGDEPRGHLDWLGLAEQRLLALTAGAVFHDDDGRLTALRERLAWLPRDVWLYKLACQWRRISEEQAFVGRAGLVGDQLGSRIVGARLARDVMRLAFLIERRYAPYPKWFGSAFARLPCAAALSPALARALAAEGWREREAALAEAYDAVGRLQLARDVPGAIAPKLGPFHARPFTVVNAEEIMAGLRAEIAEPALRSLPVIGSLDQITDSTPVVESPARARAAMAALFHDGEAGALEEA